MKKIIAMLLVFVMLFALSATAMADGENADPTFLSFMSAWRGIVSANINGEFIKVGNLEMDIWMPNVLTAQTEVPDDTFFVYADSTGNAFIKAHRVGLDGAATLEEVEEQVVDAGCVSDGMFWINGFSALVYESKENDCISAVILTDEEDTGVEFIFKGVSNQDMYTLSSLVMATIQHHSLDIEDVALMIDADLNNNWGDSRHVTYSKDGSDITINLWDENLTADDLKSVNNWDEFKAQIEKGGFAHAFWDGTTETELKIKEETKATLRFIPLDVKEEEGFDVYSGKPAKMRVYFAKAY